MSIIVFLIILAVLILVHELGHFFAARSVDVRVDEFGLGFPPRATSWKPKGSETTYSLNWLPIGGFVKIFGEEITEETVSGPDAKRSFIHKSKLAQIWILSAGVLGNFLAAWLFISIGFMSGIPASVSSFDSGVVEDARVEILSVLPGSPAERGGLLVGDRPTELVRGGENQEVISASTISEFLGDNTKPVQIHIDRGGVEEVFVISPSSDIAEGRAALGVAVDDIGIVTLPIHKAFWEGGITTVRLTGATAVGLYDLISGAIVGKADLSQVAGPVGIVGLVGDAGSLGFAYLLSFTALISINLTLINLVPFPALDGGRILFVIIEAIKGSPIKPKVANTLNTIGFALLILLMVVVTYNDIARIITG